MYYYYYRGVDRPVDRVAGEDGRTTARAGWVNGFEPDRASSLGATGSHGLGQAGGPTCSAGFVTSAVPGGTDRASPCTPTHNNSTFTFCSGNVYSETMPTNVITILWQNMIMIIIHLLGQPPTGWLAASETSPEGENGMWPNVLQHNPSPVSHSPSTWSGVPAA
jgi:hypothetical protein